MGKFTARIVYKNLFISKQFSYSFFVKNTWFCTLCMHLLRTALPGGSCGSVFCVSTYVFFIIPCSPIDVTKHPTYTAHSLEILKRVYNAGRHRPRYFRPDSRGCG